MTISALRDIDQQARAAQAPWRLTVCVEEKSGHALARILPAAIGPEFPTSRAATQYVISRAQQGAALETAALRTLMAFNTARKA